jgi:hypothetical protein
MARIIVTDMILRDISAESTNASVQAGWPGSDLLPVVSTIALMLAVNSNLSPPEILMWLQSSTRPFPKGSNCSSKTCGAGLLDAGDAVASVVQ